MPFEIPSLPALVQRAAEDLAQAGVDDVLRRSDAAVIARVVSGAAFGLYGYQAYIARQILPDTCDEDMLARWASIKSIIRTPATRATGAISVSGDGSVLVPKDFVWQTRAGIKLVVTSDTLVSAGQVPVRAENAGQAGNLLQGTRVSAISPLAGLDEEAVVSTALTGGTDQEPIERWRSRVIRSFSIQPHGGNLDDYETWALQVPGITRAWARRAWAGPGTVGVFVVRDDDDPITPDPQVLAEVKAYIESQRPVTSEVIVLAPSLLPVDFQIGLTPDTEAVRGRVELALRDLFFAEADLGVRMYRSHMTATISNTPGELDHILHFPGADIVPATNELPVLGNITWL